MATKKKQPSERRRKFSHCYDRAKYWRRLDISFFKYRAPELKGKGGGAKNMKYGPLSRDVRRMVKTM